MIFLKAGMRVPAFFMKENQEVFLKTFYKIVEFHH